MNFEHDRRQDAAGEPSLAEMTGKAIDILAKNPEGYLLLVEGGRIDHGSHSGNAYRTLSDAVALNEAVKTIVDKVNLDETPGNRDRRSQPHAHHRWLCQAG